MRIRFKDTAVLLVGVSLLPGLPASGWATKEISGDGSIDAINSGTGYSNATRANKIYASKDKRMNNIFTFIGGSRGQWRVSKIDTVKGPPLADVSFVRLVSANIQKKEPGEEWLVRGFTSNVRYATSDEVEALRKLQPELSRREASCAALILIKKSEKWWQLAQDERRKIFEEQSHHNSIGLEYLPAVARRLHHSRDLGEEFDFITWFEFAPSERPKFDELVGRLRSSEEWNYVEREVDIRLERTESE